MMLLGLFHTKNTLAYPHVDYSMIAKNNLAIVQNGNNLAIAVRSNNSKKFKILLHVSAILPD